MSTTRGETRKDFFYENPKEVNSIVMNVSGRRNLGEITREYMSIFNDRGQISLHEILDVVQECTGMDDREILENFGKYVEKRTSISAEHFEALLDEDIDRLRDGRRGEKDSRDVIRVESEVSDVPAEDPWSWGVQEYPPEESRKRDGQEELPEESWTWGIPEDGYSNVLDIEDVKKEDLEYIRERGEDIQLARKVLETEWKMDNVEDYLNWEHFSEGSLSGEAELLLSGMDRDERTETIRRMGEQGELPDREDQLSLTSVWEDRWGNLMGYDESRGKQVKLVDSYNELEERLQKMEENGESLEHMIEGAREKIDDYNSSVLKSLIREDGGYLTSGDVKEEKLLEYVDEENTWFCRNSF